MLPMSPPLPFTASTLVMLPLNGSFKSIFELVLPPPKFVFNDHGVTPPRVGSAVDSLVCSGSIISGGKVERCVISPRVQVHSFATVRDSILFEGVDVGRNCRIERAIIDKGVRLPDGTTIGVHHADDIARGLTVSDGGIVAVARNIRF